MVVPVLALSMATDQPVVMTAMRMGQEAGEDVDGSESDEDGSEQFEGEEDSR